MAIQTAGEFFAVLQRSRLLSSEQLADARRGVADTADPTDLARALAGQGLITHWQAGQLLAGRASFFLGKYKLVEPIGRGGTGSVFLGEHTTMNRRVALKILSRQVGRDPASRERLLGEARAVAALDHPNIVHAYSFDNEGDRYYIVMEYVDGRDLDALVQAEGPLDYETAADYVRQAADGLAHGHRREMVHCDVKPSHLLVNPEGVVKIVDMGLMRLTARGDDALNTPDERVLGSVDYLAPEQALESSEFDHRADIYSLGCTLYFLLTGKPPFGEGLLHEKLMMHQTQQPRSILEQRPDTPEGLIEICRKMMAKRPEDRFQSAEEVSRALADCCLPGRKPKRIVPLQRVRQLEDSSEERVPPFRVQPKPKPTADVAPRQRRSTATAGDNRTRRNALIAGGIALLGAAVLLAATTASLIRPGSGSDEGDRSRTRANRTGADGNRARDRRSVPPEELTAPQEPDANRTAEQRPQESPAEPPGADVPADTPAADDSSPDSAPGDVPSSEDHPPERPRVDQLPAAPPADAPPEDDPRPAAPEPPESEKKDPLRDLADAVQLPSPGSVTAAAAETPGPTPLGKLHLEAETSPVELELLGGETAVKGKRRFELQREQTGGRDPSWLVCFLSEGPRGAPPERTEVARISLQQKVLQFRWLSFGDGIPADHLSNCGLRVGVDGKKHWLPLGIPKEVEPMEVDLERGTSRISLPGERLPETEVLRLEVTGLGGAVPKHRFEPGRTIAAKAKTEVLFSVENLPDFKLRIGFDVKGRTAGIELSAVCTLPGQPERPFKAKQAELIMRNALALQQQIKASLHKIKNQERKKLAEKQLETIEAGMERLRSLGEVCRAIHKTGTVHFRVFAACDDHQIDLFRTPPPSAVERPR